MTRIPGRSRWTAILILDSQSPHPPAPPHGNTDSWGPCYTFFLRGGGGAVILVSGSPSSTRSLAITLATSWQKRDLVWDFCCPQFRFHNIGKRLLVFSLILNNFFRTGRVACAQWSEGSWALRSCLWTKKIQNTLTG